MAFEQKDTTNFIKYIFYVASYIHMGKLLDINSSANESSGWFLNAPWCKMNNYMTYKPESASLNYNISEFFRIVYDQFHKKNFKMVAALGASVINLVHLEGSLRKNYAKLMIESLISDEEFKSAINLIEGFNYADKKDLYDNLIRKMFDRKAYNQIKQFCIYHQSGDHIKKQLFREAMDMLHGLRSLILTQPKSNISGIGVKLTEVFTRMQVLYQIYSLEDNPKTAGQQMLILFQELACLYSNHESYINSQIREKMLEIKLNAVNMALFCLEELEDEEGYPLPVFKQDSIKNDFGIYTWLINDKELVQNVHFIKIENLKSFEVCIRGNILFNKIWPEGSIITQAERANILKAYICSEEYYDAIQYVHNGVGSSEILMDLIGIKWCDQYIQLQ